MRPVVTYPGGKEGDMLTVAFTVLAIPCLSLNGTAEGTFTDREEDSAG